MRGFGEKTAVHAAMQGHAAGRARVLPGDAASGWDFGIAAMAMHFASPVLFSEKP
jgi:hypothetical protein